MTTQQMSDSFDAFVSYFMAFGKVLLMVASVLGLCWSVALMIIGAMSDEIAELMRKTTGQDVSESVIQDLVVKVDELVVTLHQANLALLKQDVVELKRIANEVHPIKVVEVDMSRSSVFSHDGVKGQCVADKPCEARYFLKRTEVGENCDAPSVVSRVVYDENRFPHPAYPAEGTQNPTIVDSQWQWRHIYFRPIEFGVGFAQFEMELEYNCNGERIRQILPALDYTSVEQ